MADKTPGPSFEERKIAGWIKQAQKAIARKEAQIGFLERRSKLNPELRPAYQGHAHSADNAGKAERLKQQIHLIKDRTFARSAALIKNCTPGVKVKGNQLITAFLYDGKPTREEIREMKPVEKAQETYMRRLYGVDKGSPEEERKSEKDLEATQKNAEKLLSAYRARPQEKEGTFVDWDKAQEHALELIESFKSRRVEALKQENGIAYDSEATKAYVQQLAAYTLDLENGEKEAVKKEEDKEWEQEHAADAYIQRLDSAISYEYTDEGPDMDYDRD